MMHFTRNCLIVIIIVNLIQFGLFISKIGAEEPMLKGTVLYQDVAKYAEFAPHMTATTGDVKTSQWIADELKEIGLHVNLQKWQLRQFFIKECRFLMDGQNIEAFPFWYPKPTGTEPIIAPLAVMTKNTKPGELKGHIAFVSSRDAGAAIYYKGVNNWAKQAADAGAVGLVVTVVNLSGQLAAINARSPFHQTPLPLPSVIIAMKDQKVVMRAAKAGRTASLLIDGKDNQAAEAFNIIGTLKRGNKWIVVTTPTSGWFTCAGERGPGVALFLALARWASQSKSRFSYLFMGNSGHELDNIGAHHTLDKYAPPVKDVACWIHLGASIATRAWKRTEKGFKPLPKVNDRLNLVGTEDLMPILNAAFENVPGYKPRSKGRIAGELRHFITAGYRAFGFFGGHAFFHTRQDTPATTGPEFLEPVGGALIKSIQEVEEGQ